MVKKDQAMPSVLCQRISMAARLSPHDIFASFVPSSATKPNITSMPVILYEYTCAYDQKAAGRQRVRYEVDSAIAARYCCRQILDKALESYQESCPWLHIDPSLTAAVRQLPLQTSC